MKKLLTLALLLTGLAVSAQTPISNQHKQVLRATVTCTVKYNNVSFNKVQQDSMLMLHAKGYKLDYVVNNNGKAYIKLFKIGR